MNVLFPTPLGPATTVRTGRRELVTARQFADDVASAICTNTILKAAIIRRVHEQSISISASPTIVDRMTRGKLGCQIAPDAVAETAWEIAMIGGYVARQMR